MDNLNNEVFEEQACCNQCAECFDHEPECCGGYSEHNNCCPHDRKRRKKYNCCCCQFIKKADEVSDIANEMKSDFSKIRSRIAGNENLIEESRNELSEEILRAIDRENQIENLFTGGVDLDDYYTKSEVDRKIAEGGNFDPTQYYTKSQIDSINQAQNALIASKTDNADLASVATSGSYNDLTDKPTIPTVPTKVSELTNDSGFITSSAISGKQDTLVSGTNIKTVNGQSVLGAGDITIQGGSTVTVDSALSNTSTNPVLNKIITEALQNIGGMPNKSYNPSSNSGLGRKTFELNDNSNILTQSDFNQANTIYVIPYDFDLNGQTITIPAGCILDFEGGSLSNGTLVGNDTQIRADKAPIFTGITIEGTWNVHYITTDWFSDAALNNGLKNVFALQNDNIYNTLIIEKGDYTVSYNNDENYEILSCKSNLKLIINGHIILTGTSSSKYNIISIYNLTNVEVCGHGTITGDVDTHTGSTGEHGMGITIVHSSSNITIKDISIEKCWGDGIYLGNATDDYNLQNYNIVIKGVKIDGCRRQGISITDVEHCDIKNCIIKNIAGTSPQAAIDIEPNDWKTEEVSGESIVVASHECKHIVIENNVILNCVIGVLMTNGKSNKSDIVVKNNSISCGSFGIRTHYVNEQLLIESNNIECEYGAINTTGDSRPTQTYIINNTITTTLNGSQPNDKNFAAISLYGSYNSIISGNTITTNLEDVIFSRGNCSIIGNKIVSNANLLSFKGHIDVSMTFSGNDITVNRILPGSGTSENKYSLSFYNNVINLNIATAIYLYKKNIFQGNKFINTTTDALLLAFRTITGFDSLFFSNNYVENFIIQFQAENMISDGNLFKYKNNYTQLKSNEGYLITANDIFKNNIVDIDATTDISDLNFIVYSGSSAKSLVKDNKFKLNSINAKMLYDSASLTSHFVGNVIEGAENVVKLINENSEIGFVDGTYSRRGNTVSRPSLPAQSCYIGFEYFDTTILKPIYWNGSGWIDANGTAVQN